MFQWWEYTSLVVTNYRLTLTQVTFFENIDALKINYKLNNFNVTKNRKLV